jgi:DNA polymerase-4
MVRKILHMDLDAFFCSVEELRDPSLKGKAFAVGGQPGSRGVISTASYAARKFGVHSALPTSQALRLCPGLILVSSFHSGYEEVSRQVMKIVGDYSPLVETLSIDEAFLDVSDLPDTPLQIARSLQSRINRETSLPCSIGGASNMLVAKIANDYGKHLHKDPTPPNAITIVEPGTEAAFLAPLPIDALWGVGPKTAERLKALHIHTIGDLAGRSESEMSRLFGQSGCDLLDRARGIDSREIQVEHEAKSISQEVTYDQDTGDEEYLLKTIRRLSANVGSQLRKQGITAKTVRIKIRWANFETHTRQAALTRPTDCDSVITSTAIDLFKKIWTAGKKVRLIGVGTAQFSQEPVQLNLLEKTDDREKRLLRSVDELRERFGKQIVYHGFDLDEIRNRKRTS